ncbi:MAG: dUTP diphosphatase [Actinobacteria bacterium]|nr:dUTP diphosphatase [Actinomycetota bacterium]
MEAHAITRPEVESTLRFKKLHPDAVVPTRAHDGDAGCDIYARESLTLRPGERGRVGTGIAVAIPEGHAGMVLPRSGLAHKHGVTLTNSPGLIDAGYRGELMVLLVNTDRDDAYTVNPGDRIAQLVLVPFSAPNWTEVEDFEDTTRGEGGFGSSGF